jgi:radical SAM protein with 4Fe4S-binding SPASM domain
MLLLDQIKEPKKTKYFQERHSMFKRLKSPLNTQIEVTPSCTNECQHCYNFWRNSCHDKPPNTGILRESDAEIIVQKLSDSEVFNIVVTGGEPLLNFQTCITCIRSAKAKRIGVSMNSNVVLLTLKKAELLAEAGLKHILTSVLGPTADIHDKLTQRQGSFKKLMVGIKNAQSAGINVSANMVITQLNFAHIRSTAELVKSLGITNFTATRAGCPGNCPDFSKFALSRDQLIQYLNTLVQVNKELGLDIDALEPTPYCGLHGVTDPIQFTSRKCCAGLTTMTVSYDGTVRPCSHFDESCGNLLIEDLATVWSRMDPWRQGENIPDECKVCVLLPLCCGGCRMEAKTRGGGVNKLDPYATPEHALKMEQVIRSSFESSSRVELPRFKTVTFKYDKEHLEV